MTVAVKDVPKFDPDAEIVGLSLTVPSWTGSLKRMQEKDMSEVSMKAKLDLARNLNELKRQLDRLLYVMGVTNHGRL
jgi:hypothetical protein